MLSMKFTDFVLSLEEVLPNFHLHRSLNFFAAVTTILVVSRIMKVNTDKILI